MNFVLIIIIILLILIIYSNIKEYFVDNSCKFEPESPDTWGPAIKGLKTLSFNKDECIAVCSDKLGCKARNCIKLCNECSSKKTCKWIETKECDYIPRGLEISPCIDLCLKEVKENDNCGSTHEEKYKKCKELCNSCDDNKRCKWLATKKDKKTKLKCDFNPWGPNKRACTDRCVSNDRYLWGGDHCNDSTCSAICESCDDDKYCKWIIEEKDKDEIIEDTGDRPPKQKIELISGNGKSVIQWKAKQHPKSKSNPDNFKIIGYIVQYYKTYKPIEGVFTKNIGESYSNSDNIDFNGVYNMYTLNGLENGENYTIVLIPVNLNGAGKESNLANTTPRDNIKIEL